MAFYQRYNLGGQNRHLIRTDCEQSQADLKLFKGADVAGWEAQLDSNQRGTKHKTGERHGSARRPQATDSNFDGGWARYGVSKTCGLMPILGGERKASIFVMRPFLLSTTPLLGRAFSGWPPLEKPKALGFPLAKVMMCRPAGLYFRQ